MAAKLEMTWVNTMLKWGPWVLATLGQDGNTMLWRFRIGTAPASAPYEDMGDCAQDAESEVRRLLKAAGVGVE